MMENARLGLDERTLLILQKVKVNQYGECSLERKIPYGIALEFDA